MTTLAGSSAALVGSCAEAGATAGEPVSAIGGTVFSMTLHPYAAVLRTFVLAPNDIGVLSFDATAGGRVTLGTGAGVLNVCSSLLDCMGNANVQTLVGLDSTQGNVPAACIAADINAACDLTNTRDAFFGLPASGFPLVCDDPADVTVSSTLCATQLADGFDLSQGQAIVFVYVGSLKASSFDIAVGGFDITTDGVDPAGCAANSIVGATADSDSEPPTPTNTPRATATATATVSPTPSRPGPGGVIPVIPSPADPAGLVLIIGLAAGLLFPVRRMSRR